MPQHYSGEHRRDLGKKGLSVSGRISVLYWISSIAIGSMIILFGKHHCFNDRAAHWARILRLRSGEIIPGSSNEYSGWIVSSEQGKIITFNNTAVNSPFVYFPSLIVRGDFRVSSIATLVCATSLIGLAIWIAGCYANIIAAVAILPTTFFGMIFPTADAITNSFCLLFIAVVLWLYQRNDVLHCSHIVLLCMLGIMLGQVKITCSVIALFVFFLFPKTSSKKMKLSLSLPVLCTFGSMWLWRIQSSHIAVAPNRISLQQTHNLEMQLLHSPWKMLPLIGRALFEPLDFDKERIKGQLVNPRRNLQFFTGTETVQLPLTIMAPVLIAIMMLLIVHASYQRMHKYQIAIVLMIAVLYYVLSCIAMAVTWSGTIDGYVSGMQSRYLIPVLPLIFLLFPNLIKYENINRKALKVSVVSLTFFSYAGILISYLIQWN